MNYLQLKTDIAEVIRTNGNEEITGEVLQYILLQMVTSLGKDFQFAGKGTPETEVGTPDENMAWILGAGTYQNFGTQFTVAENEFAIAMYNGAFDVKKVAVGRPMDTQIEIGSPNPVENDAIAQEFLKLRGAGYLFFGLAAVNTEPPTERPEKIFFLAAEGGVYQNYGNLNVPTGISVIKWNGSSWSIDILWQCDSEPLAGSQNLVLSGGVKTELNTKVDKVEGKGLSEADYTNAEKGKLGALPTALELADMLGQKQNVLTFDNEPTEGSANPVTSDGIHEAIKNFITKAVNDLLYYYTKSETYTKTEVDNLIAAIKQFNILAVPVLPTASADTMGTLYLVPSEDQSEPNNIKDEYITLSKTEGGTTTYSWEKIGTTEIDLSNYPTFDQMNAAIAAALADYYTKAQIDAALAELEGRLSVVSLSADKSVILTNTSSQIALTARTGVAATSLTIERGGVTVGTGTGSLLVVSDTVNIAAAGDLTYTLTAVIGGVTRTEPLTVAVKDAVLYGAGTVATDITTKATARLTPEGRYTITAAAGDNLFILVPMGMTVNGMTMSGLEVPLEVPTGVIVDGVQYLCYKSSNVYDAGSYTINVY